MPTRIKICCIASREEARLAIQCGASALGLVSAMPSGPGVIPESDIARIVSAVPPGVASVLLTASQDIPTIIDQQHRLRVNTVQLVDRVSSGAHRELRQALPGVHLIQVIHVNDAGAIDEALRCAGSVDAVLLDSGNPNLPTKELGGTGRTHDWSLSSKIVQRSPCPVFLAGGLNANNVAEAIRQVEPFGVDVCSGVRSAGGLDLDKLGGFVRAVRDARTGMQHETRIQ